MRAVMRRRMGRPLRMKMKLLGLEWSNGTLQRQRNINVEVNESQAFWYILQIVWIFRRTYIINADYMKWNLMVLPCCLNFAPIILVHLSCFVGFLLICCPHTTRLMKKNTEGLNSSRHFIAPIKECILKVCIFLINISIMSNIKLLATWI